MHYIGKLWLRKPCSLEEIGKGLGLFDTKQYGEDLIGHYRPESTDFGRAIVLIHVSWGGVERVEKIRIWAHLQTNLSEEQLEEELMSKMLALQRKK